MSIVFTPTAERGSQWSITIGNQVLAEVSQGTVKALLHRHGMSLTKADAEIASAKLRASAASAQ
jgi:hypothetical protein